MKRDVLVGMLLVNTVPHVLTGSAGARCRTPFGGVSSSAGQNLAWAAVNAGAAVAILACRSWSGQDDAEDCRVRVGVGMFAMAAFGVLYDASAAGRRDRHDRAVVASASRGASASW